MHSIPSHDALIASIGQSFTFSTPQGREIEARLVAAPTGTPMDDDYVCYAATFELPAGIQLPQDVYRIAASDGAAWDLLATPTRPSADGKANLTVVVHCLRG
ncbi:DUF6916 family protein [Trinickia fusca]|uniref:DUF6916 domain-containing protein n=1 Tax=Trinickia fusca TaxID=2419777 RepID=A0A494XJ56_9BURK|nr:hypothetical protein [Trinickia fusca]RKP48114.1 hypothetical protein D7S89_12205 [Trinickia fusca]